MEGLPGWVISSMPGPPPRQHKTWKTIHTKHTLIRPNKANMECWLRRPNDIRGPWGHKVFWHLSYMWGKTPKKPHPVLTGDRTRACCVTSAHDTTCSTAVDLGVTTLLTSQVISVVFYYSEHEKSDKFCSEALISAWGSFTCRISTTRDPRLYYPSEGSHTQDFYTLKKSIDPGRIWTREPRIQWRVW